jgi:hypothetical protein
MDVQRNEEKSNIPLKIEFGLLAVVLNHSGVGFARGRYPLGWEGQTPGLVRFMV